MSAPESKGGLVPPGAKTKPLRVKKAPKFSAVKDLLARVVATRRPVVSRPDLIALKDAPAAPEAESAELLQPLLAAPAAQLLRALMTTAAAAKSVPAVAKAVADFGRSLYRAHPQVRDLMRDVDVVPPEEDLDITRLRNDLQKIKTARDARTGEIKTGPEAKGKEAQRRVRALRRDAEMLRDAVIALHYAQGQLDEPFIMELLSERTRTARRADLSARADALFWLLAKGTESQGLAVVISAFEERLSAHRSAASSAVARAEALEREAASRQAAIDELQADMERLQVQVGAHAKKIEVLNARVAEMQEAARTAAIHHTDDMSRLRTRVLRLLEGEKSHLSDSLAALASRPPKTDVAVSYVTTAHDRIAAEIQELRKAA
jgi:chromosome segregation ATPase